MPSAINPRLGKMINARNRIRVIQTSNSLNESTKTRDVSLKKKISRITTSSGSPFDKSNSKKSELLYPLAQRQKQSQDHVKELLKYSMMNLEVSPRKNFILTPADLNKKVVLSDMAAAANSELIQKFIANPNEPISTKDFLEI